MATLQHIALVLFVMSLTLFFVAKELRVCRAAAAVAIVSSMPMIALSLIITQR